MKIKITLYALLGVVLLVGVLFTGTSGLSRENLDVYQTAMELQEEMEAVSFSGFRVAEYPVSFYDGKKDYVVTVKDNEYTVSTRKPVLPTFVGTAYPVEDKYQIFLPTVEKFSELFGMINTAGNLSDAMNEGSLNFTEDEYGSLEHVATIWHEGTHAFQMTYYKDAISSILPEEFDFAGNSGESLILTEVDSNPKVVELYSKEMELLKQAVLTSDIDKVKSLVIQYKEMDEKRRSLLSEETLLLEEYYERVEGTANYIESQAYGLLYSETAATERYLKTLDSYEVANSKYYIMGMAKCRILDTLCPEWKETYDFSQSLTGLIYQYAGLE